MLAERGVIGAPNADEAQPSERPIRVFLLDDHEVVRRGVADLIDAADDMRVVAEASTVAQARQVVRDSRPDVAVIDVRLADGDGIEVCRDIKRCCPEVKCLILTSFADDKALIDAAMAGAIGYVLKRVRGNELIESIRKAAAGTQVLDSATVRMAMRRLRSSDDGRVASLTPQEHQIFDFVGKGYSNRQIADEMQLAEKTVKNYVSNMLAKLGMSSRTQAAAFSARLDERRRHWSE